MEEQGPVGKHALLVWPPPSPPRRISTTLAPRTLARTPRSRTATALPLFCVIRDTHTLSICLFFCPLLLSFSASIY